MSSDNTKRAPRPIDPPSLPPWLSRSDLARPEEEVTDQVPTPPPSSLSRPPEPEAPESASGPAHPEPPPQEPEPAEDPRALAERLAREAKARLAASKAAETKARAQEDLAPVELAAAPSPAEPAPVASPDPAPAESPAPAEAAAPSPDESLAARASKVKRPMSAAEALAKALQGSQAPAPKAKRPRKSKPRSKPAPQASDPVVEARAAAGAAEIAKAAALTARLLPGAQLKGPPVPVTQPEVFRAVWRAHRARALHEQDLDMVVTASVLLDAVDRLPAGTLFAVDVAFQGERHAIWLDTARKTILGVARPPDVYLTGR